MTTPEGRAALTVEALETALVDEWGGYPARRIAVTLWPLIEADRQRVWDSAIEHVAVTADAASWPVLADSIRGMKKDFRP